MHLAEAAVQGFGRVQKSRGRADRAEHAGGVARDVLGLADAGDVDAAAAAERGADYLDGARDGGDVQAAAQCGEFGQCEVEEIFDFDGRVADSGLARLGVEARRRQRQRLGIEIENFLAHIEARRKRAEARHRDRAGRIGEPSDLFPRQAETKAGANAREERVAGAGRIDLLDLEGGHANRSVAGRDRASFVAFGDDDGAIAVLGANRVGNFQRIAAVAGDFAGGGLRRLEPGREFQRAFELGARSDRSDRVGGRHVNVENRGNRMSAREQQNRDHGPQRELRNLGRDQIGAADERAVAVADLGRRELGGRAARHVDRAIARGIDEDRRERGGGAVEGQVMADAEAIHAVAQELAVAIVAHLAEDAGFEPEDAAPSEMVQDEAADLRAFDRGAGGMRAQQDFFVGADDARRAVEQVNHHAAASDDVEFLFSHCAPQIFVP